MRAIEGASAAPSTARTWLTLGLLSSLYFISFVDRVILGLLVAPLKADLGVSDVQLGLLFGPAFAAFYALVGLPMARIADRGARLPLIVLGSAAWGLCTMASAFVHSYGALVGLRVGLAVGEAALTPAVYALIGASFASQSRVRAASIYSAVGVAGGAGAYILGSAVIRGLGAGRVRLPGLALTFAPWQAVLLLVGLPAVAGALLVALLGREPRQRAAGGVRGAQAPAQGAAWAQLRRHGRMYLPLFAGAGVLQAVNAAFAAWGPEYLRRDLGWPIADAGLAFGLSGLVGAVAGVLVVPALARAWQQRGRADAIAAASLIAGVLGGLAAVAGPISGGGAVFLLSTALAAFGLYGSSTGLVVAMQVLAPLRVRATFVALFILSITLFGQGLGPPAVAWVGQVARLPLGPALAIVSLAATLAGLALLSLARAPLAGYFAAQAGDPQDA